MTEDTPLPFNLPAVHRKKITVDFNGGNQSSDAGLLLLREAERKLGVCQRLAAAIPDRRDPDRILHTMHEMLMERVSAIACGYKDANDLDELRHDPLMKLAVDRCPETGDPLASQPTISRMENSPSKTDAARAAVAMVDQFCASVTPGEVEMFDIDDSFVAARTPKGTEVRTVIKHVTKLLQERWPNTRIVWRGDGHYGRVEAMDWIEENGDSDYIFGLPGNPVLDQQVAEIADNLRFHHATSHQEKVRTHTSFRYQAGSWTHPRKVVARLECSLQPDSGGTTTNGMRQEVDIRYVVTSLKGSAEHLYEDVYCQRGQMENLIKLHKAQMASDRMSCHSATANQGRLILHTAAYWLMLSVRDAIPQTHPLAKAEFNTLRERLIKIGARVIEHLARIRIQLPTSCPEGELFRAIALGLAPSG